MNQREHRASQRVYGDRLFVRTVPLRVALASSDHHDAARDNSAIVCALKAHRLCVRDVRHAALITLAGATVAHGEFLLRATPVVCDVATAVRLPDVLTVVRLLQAKTPTPTPNSQPTSPTSHTCILVMYRYGTCTLCTNHA